ncbi:MAG: hypothetical protein IPF82_13835 [Blastocatellia bacterium]|nr:hypothetical protein [Blastocatellia bacterium]
MICEDGDDLAGALDAYRSLGYEADAAYCIDVLMTLGELRAYIDARPDDPNADWLRYALGVRLLRTGSYDLARIELMRVRTGSSELDRWTSHGTPETEPFTFESAAKDSKAFNPAVRLPRQHWLAADLQTASDLQALRLQAIRTATDEVAAEAQYQYAAYLFDREALLFYNPTLWWGSRTDLLNTLAYADDFRLPGEGARVWYATNQHDALAQSVDAFLDVVDRYPSTAAAADALYSAAVAHERLSQFNGYWSVQYAAGRHAGRRLVTYDDVRRAYPAYRFPRGTFGWEAATRTVNGAPGWDPLPPKAKPVPAWRRYATRGPEVIAEFGGPVVTAVWGTIRTATNWLVDLVKRATILTLQAILLVVILGAWILTVRSSLRLALETANGHVRARALLPASLAYRTRDYRWLAWAAGQMTSLREGVAALSITRCGAEKGEASSETRLDDRVVVFIERARLFVSTTPEGFACVLVVVTHVPFLLLMAMAM